MSRPRLREFKVGDTVRHKDDHTEGRVTEANWSAFKVEWSDGLVAIYQHHDAHLYGVALLSKLDKEST